MGNPLPTAIPIRTMVAALLALAALSCASEFGARKRIQRVPPKDCDRLQAADHRVRQYRTGDRVQLAWVRNSENYNNFLGQTKALYNGSIPDTSYRNALNSFLGGGSSNDRSLSIASSRICPRVS